MTAAVVGTRRGTDRKEETPLTEARLLTLEIYDRPWQRLTSCRRWAVDRLANRSRSRSNSLSRSFPLPRRAEAACFCDLVLFSRFRLSLSLATTRYRYTTSIRGAAVHPWPRRPGNLSIVVTENRYITFASRFFPSMRDVIVLKVLTAPSVRWKQRKWKKLCVEGGGQKRGRCFVLEDSSDSGRLMRSWIEIVVIDIHVAVGRWSTDRSPRFIIVNRCIIKFARILEHHVWASGISQRILFDSVRDVQVPVLRIRVSNNFADRRNWTN